MGLHGRRRLLGLRGLRDCQGFRALGYNGLDVYVVAEGLGLGEEVFAERRILVVTHAKVSAITARSSRASIGSESPHDQEEKLASITDLHSDLELHLGPHLHHGAHGGSVCLDTGPRLPDLHLDHG